jgi:hypothetical protein
MRIFFAGAETSPYGNVLKRLKAENVLMSFFIVGKKNEKAIIKTLTGYRNIFMDSGGFTARVQGKDIDVHEYAKFLVKYKDYLFCYANLDQKRTEDTLKNQEILEGYGLKPIPVFHRDEWERRDIKLLNSYMDRSDYIALGGVAGSNVSKDYVTAYLDWCFHHILKHKEKRIKVHGFGMTSPTTLLRYPFYSVDSTTWISGGKFGEVLKSKDFGLALKRLNYRKNKDIIMKEFLYAEKLLSRRDAEKNRDYHNAHMYIELQNLITRIWKYRGVTWD